MSSKQNRFLSGRDLLQVQRVGTGLLSYLCVCYHCLNTHNSLGCWTVFQRHKSIGAKDFEESIVRDWWAEREPRVEDEFEQWAWDGTFCQARHDHNQEGGGKTTKWDWMRNLVVTKFWWQWTMRWPLGVAGMMLCDTYCDVQDLLSWHIMISGGDNRWCGNLLVWGEAK